MFLTGEGALLAVALAALVCGLVGAWAMLRIGVRRTDRDGATGDVAKAGNVRRVAVPSGTAQKV